MLSFNDGRPIAIIKNGKNHNQIINITDDTETEKNIINNNPLDLIEDIYNIQGNRRNKKKMTRNNMSLIKNALISDDNLYDESLYEIILNAKNDSKNISKKEFKIYDDGIIQPLPRFNKTERAYIAGQTECGKTHYIKNYLKQLRIVFPHKKIFVFSDLESDKEIDVIKNLIRFKIDEGLLNKKPINPELFRDSICVFDDIDSIQNSKLYKYIQTLRDSLLRRGRHEDISVIVTSHLLTNYKDTRIVLNEANSITFFCRSGSVQGVKYLLKTYVGLDKIGIQKILNLPSRWVTIHKNHPQYVLYEKGVYIL